MGLGPIPRIFESSSTDAVTPRTASREPLSLSVMVHTASPWPQGSLACQPLAPLLVCIRCGCCVDDQSNRASSLSRHHSRTRGKTSETSSVAQAVFAESREIQGGLRAPVGGNTKRIGCVTSVTWKLICMSSSPPFSRTCLLPHCLNFEPSATVMSIFRPRDSSGTSWTCCAPHTDRFVAVSTRMSTVDRLQCQGCEC